MSALLSTLRHIGFYSQKYGVTINRRKYLCTLTAVNPVTPWLGQAYSAMFLFQARLDGFHKTPRQLLRHGIVQLVWSQLPTANSPPFMENSPKAKGKKNSDCCHNVVSKTTTRYSLLTQYSRNDAVVDY